jgi:hypothetical protein
MQSRRSCSLMKLVPPPLFRTGPEGLPVIVRARGDARVAAAIEFFAVTIRNRNTRMAYACVPYMIKRRAEPAALIYSICCHTLRTIGLPPIYGRAERWSTHRLLPITNRRERRNYMTEPRRTVVRRGRADINLSGSIRL